MGKHGPNPSFQNYQDVHNKWIRRYQDAGFLLRDGLQWKALGDSAILLSGRLVCEGGIYIDVEKVLAILEGEGPTATVQRMTYTYNAVLWPFGNILRYDSPQPPHRIEHHVHRYNVLGAGEEISCTDILDENEQPTLGEVTAELCTWYDTYTEEIDSLRVANDCRVPPEGPPDASAWDVQIDW